MPRTPPFPGPQCALSQCEPGVGLKPRRHFHRHRAGKTWRLGAGGAHPPRPREAGLTPAAVVRPARALARTLPGDHVPFTCTCAVFVGFAAGVLGVVLLFVLGELGHVGCGPSSQLTDHPESVLTGLEGSGAWNRV